MLIITLFLTKLPFLCYPIRNSSAVNSIVLDTFGGSGSTLIACQQMDKICFVMELDPKYASVIVRRYIELCGSEDVFLFKDNRKIPYLEAVELNECHNINAIV